MIAVVGVELGIARLQSALHQIAPGKNDMAGTPFFASEKESPRKKAPASDANLGGVRRPKRAPFGGTDRAGRAWGCRGTRNHVRLPRRRPHRY